ncbi:acyltransferase [Methylococcaceae bacterium WWC4]|nr:acyltransferase [Methylococcaceae bacterium WWC4]
MCEKTPQRVEYFDVLRGIAIIGVVAIHSSGVGLQFKDDVYNFHFTVIWRNLVNFSVPLFLAISGYFLSKKSVGNINDYVLFIKKQVTRVYIPLLFWSFVWLFLAVFVENKPLSNELVKLVSFQSSAPYYFIALIIQYYLLLPLLKRLNNKTGLFISALASIMMALIIFYLRHYTHIKLPLILYAGNFITWGMFFVLGLCLNSSMQFKLSNKTMLFLTIIFYALSCVETYVLMNAFHQAENAVTAVKASSFLYSFFLIVFLFNRRGVIKPRILKHIGRISFGIYLIHMFILLVLPDTLSRLCPGLQKTTIAYQLSLIVTTIFICYIFILLFNRILSSKASQFIGFK